MKEIESQVFHKNLLNMVMDYGVPTLQFVGGGLQIVTAVGIDVVGCSTVIMCGLAVGGSSVLIANGVDDISTAWKNLGQQSRNHTNSLFLNNLGVDEAQASWIKLVFGAFSVGAELGTIKAGLNTSINADKVLTDNIVNAVTIIM